MAVVRLGAHLALLLAWALWIALYRPSVRYDENRVVVTNIGRVHVLPWGQIAAVDQGLNLVFRLRDGRTLNAWGSPYPRRPGNIELMLDRRTRPEYDFHRNAAMLEHYVAVARPSADPAGRRCRRHRCGADRRRRGGGRRGAG